MIVNFCFYNKINIDKNSFYRFAVAKEDTQFSDRFLSGFAQFSLLNHGHRTTTWAITMRKNRVLNLERIVLPADIWLYF